jgi:hypothetical protein
MIERERLAQTQSTRPSKRRAQASRAIEQVDSIIREMSPITTTVAATVDQQNSPKA